MLRSPHSAEYSFDHGLRLALTKRAMSGKQTKDHWPVDEIEQELTVNVFSDFATVDAALPHHAGRIPPCIEKTLPKQRQKFRVALTFCQELSEEASEGAGVEGNHGFQLFRKIRLCRSGVRQHDLFRHARQIRVESHLALVGPPFVDRRFTDAGSLGDRVRRDLAQRLSLEQVESRLENCGFCGNASTAPPRLRLADIFGLRCLCDLATPEYKRDT